MTATESLVAALVALQAKLPTIERTQTAEVETRTGGKFKYSYADLADVSKAILPMLAEVGLCFTCGPTLNASGVFVLRWSLIHVSGERESGEYPLPTGTPQQVGSGVTYARRYTLAAVVGLSMVDDDDGQAASVVHREPAPKKSAGTRRTSGSREPDGEDVPRPMVDAQLRRIMQLLGQLGRPYGDDTKAKTLKEFGTWLGYALGSVKDIRSFSDARIVIGHLEDLLVDPRPGADEVPS